MENEARLPNSPRFGMLLRQYRIAAGLSQEALAERARLSINGVSALERGYRRTPQRETLALLAAALSLNEDQRREFESAGLESQRGRVGTPVTIGPWRNGDPSLPLPLSSFIGREKELEELSALMREHRLVTVTGAGGIGKTQTALQAVISLDVPATSTVRFVDLARVREASTVATAVATALGVQEVPNRQLLETLVAYLKNKQVLLILDNCEHVIEEAARVATSLLSACPKVNILATSREPLRIAAEHVYRLPSLDICAAVVLFTDRARAIDFHFTLTAENEAIAKGLCARLDGIPLAIELAAARVNLLPLKELAKKLGERLQILSGGERTASPRQQTMRATIEWSYNLLSPLERCAFERLSVFAGGFTLDSAAMVCLDEATSETSIVDTLSSLISKSLVVADLDSAEPRYRLLEPFRDYANERLIIRGEQEMVSHRLAAACLASAHRLDALYESGSDEMWYALVREERDNWRASLQWVFSGSHDALLGQRLVGALTQFWRYFAPVEGRLWTETAVALVTDATPADVVAALAYARAHVAWQLREYQTQIASSERAIRHYRRVEDLFGVARAQLTAANALNVLDRVEAADSYAREALAFARLHGHRRLAAYALITLCYLSTDAVFAKSCILEAIQIHHAIGAREEATLLTLTHLAVCEFAAGDAESAARRGLEYLETVRATDVQVGTINRPITAIYLAALGRYDEADKVTRQTLIFGREQQIEALTAFSMQLRAALAALNPRVVEENAADRAIRVLGYVEAHAAAAGSRDFLHYRFLDLEGHSVANRALGRMREALGARRVDDLLVEGATMTEDQAIAEALDI